MFWSLTTLLYCFGKHAWVDILHIKGKQFSQLDWLTYGHIAQLIIVPRCSYVIQQNAQVMENYLDMIECIYQLGDFME